MMKYLLTRKDQLKTAKWAGGTTTQLAIFPHTAEYGKFNFDFRISYATVEIPESTFTFMPGVTRHLTILQGQLEIDHTQRYQKILRPFDQDIFNGEWLTTAKGKVTDFNLMTRGTASGISEVLLLDAKTKQELITNADFNYTSIFVWKGSLEIKIKDKIIPIETGDFMLVEHTGAANIDLHSLSPSELIVCRIKNE
jgi:environmental stress-induced protein Ves